MKNILNSKVLAIFFAIGVVGICAMVYNPANGSDGECNDVIPLEMPPFIQGVSASDIDEVTAGASFLEEEAGISAYVHVGQEIDLEKAKSAFKSIGTTSESYIIGEIELPGLSEDVYPHAYVSKNGWIVAYYSKYAPASKIMEWHKYDGGAITTTTLEDAMREICLEIKVPFVTIKDDIDYYDFEYPDANRMMLITDMTPRGKNYQSDSFNLEMPIDCGLYEGSWSHYFTGDLRIEDTSSNIKIDEDVVSTRRGVYKGTHFGYGEFTSKQLEAAVLHTVLAEHDTAHWGEESITGVATVLIYRTS